LLLLTDRLKIRGKLPQVQIRLSDDRIIELLELTTSIPLPDAALPADSTEEPDGGYQVSGSLFSQPTEAGTSNLPWPVQFPMTCPASPYLSNLP